MSLKRYSARRDGNELEIIRALEKAGALVIRLDRPLDLLVGYGGVWRILEVKRPKGAVREGQAAFMRLAAARGLPAHLVRTPEEALKVFR